MLDLLCKLIKTPSFSREEGAACTVLQNWMQERGLSPHRVGDNLWCCDDPVGPDGVLAPSDKPTILLNAHLDTVKPSPAYTRDPFDATVENGCIYGLGSNDDGGSLVALLAAYMHLGRKSQPYRLIYSATAQEEISGTGGLEAILPFIGKIDLGVIGEPTGMKMAVAERGLMVLDCVAVGRSGHAAREEGINAIYQALPDIEWFRTHNFEKVSPYLGTVKMSVTMINAGTQHNVIPAECTFTVDVRSNGLYSNSELLESIRRNVRCSVKERSTRLSSSHIEMSHPIVRRGLTLGLEPFGSPTTSNQSISPFTTIKIGPGESSRSHSADEYIRLDEIDRGIDTYIKLLDSLNLKTDSSYETLGQGLYPG